MATTVIIMRHAKAVEGDYPGAEDVRRPLAEEGKETQAKMAKFLKDKGYHIDLIVSSPFLRARQSALRVADEFKAPAEWEFCLMDPININDLLEKIPDPQEGRCVAFIGHDPSISDFINKLCGDQVIQGGMVKSGAAVVEVGENTLGGGKFLGLFTPADLEKE